VFNWGLCAPVLRVMHLSYRGQRAVHVLQSMASLHKEIAFCLRAFESKDREQGFRLS
jgi:hypothetical protein